MEKSCGCVIFNDDKVLVIKQLSGFYGFPKGHVEKLETEVETAHRETLEEVGLDVSIDSSKCFKISYLVHDVTFKEVVYFISFLKNDSPIKIQEDELADAFWVECSHVYDILSFDNLKKLWLEIYDYYRKVYNG